MSYTFGMKTAVSLPDTLFRQCEELARAQRISRSALYQRALKAYVAAQSDVTEQINAALDAIGEDPENETWVKAATRHAARRRSG
jgi:predicted transcriptional regulator